MKISYRKLEVANFHEVATNFTGGGGGGGGEKKKKCAPLT